MKWLGLTGGIATGKSTVKKLIQGRGFKVIDADEISHEITSPGRLGYNKIISYFGTDVLNADLTINRQKLGALVFSNEPLRLQLESILHPLIQDEVGRQKEVYKLQKEEVCFYDIPLLYEKSRQAEFDATVVVWCHPDKQKTRLMHRNHLTSDQAQARLNAQWPLIEKIRRASHCIDNSTDLEALSRQVKVLLHKLVP